MNWSITTGLNWQPVATAPVNTRILGFSPGNAVLPRSVEIVSGSADRWYDDEGYCYSITHWQPLPEPPQ